jgi:predicted RNase H-related nuclease YkuK (DUF458 family)
MWKTLSEVRIADILQFVREATSNGQAVHVGTDSLQSGRSTQFVTVVVILTPTRAGASRTGARFKALIKPESWAASHAADHVVRSQGKLPPHDTVAS